MKLSFLIQLFLILLLTISVFLVFTNSVTGRIKLIMIVFCVVLGLYLYSKMHVFKDYNEFISTPESAKNNTMSVLNKYLKKSDGKFTMSCWIFIDDWNYKYGETKTILQKQLPTTSGMKNLPTIQLGAYKNDLIINIDTFEEDVNSYEDSLKSYLIDDLSGYTVADLSDSIISCSGEDVDAKIYIDTSPAYAVNDDSDTDQAKCADAAGTAQTIEVKNIYLQKWVNIIITISDRSIDVYMNGKLIKTKTLNNVIDTTALNMGDIDIVPDGGFGGYISKVRYYPSYISPQKAWTIYKDGFGDAFESTLNQYNMSLTFYKDAVAQNKFYLF